MLHSLFLLVTGILFSLILFLIQPFYTFNLWFADQLLGISSPSPNIVVVGIDDASLEAYGKISEWPRSLHAAAITNLKRTGAAVIGYDVLFAGDSLYDAELAESMRQSGNVVLAVAGSTRVSGSEKVFTMNKFILPADTLREDSACLGHVNIAPDPDGKVRRIPLIASDLNGKIYPAFSIAMLYTLFQTSEPENYVIENNKISLLMRQIPVDAEYNMRLNYAVTDKSLIILSYKDIIENNYDPSLIENKIVLVGVTATGELDSWPVPTSTVRISGILIHAAAIDTILRMQFTTEAGNGISLSLMLLMTLICVLVFPWLGVWKRLDIIKVTIIAVILILVYIAMAALISNHGLIINVLYPDLIIIVLFICNIIYMVIQEQNDKKFVKELFGRYVSPQISQEIVFLASEGELKLGGEEREVTILFADIRNFTTISEKLSPDGVVTMLNSCLPVMIEAIVQNGGLVNKFAGDNLMGVWNAPQTQMGHPEMAVKAAWEAQIKMAELNRSRPELANVEFGIGINTGKALAGNIGSSGRVEYTVIGDAVNLASRICSAAPGKEILIGPETYNRCREFLEAEPLPPQVFKGKTQPIVVYRVKVWRKVNE